MERTSWFNRSGQHFRISKDSLEKIEREGKKAGKYLTFNQVKQGWELTDTRNDFNSGRTWKYACRYEDEFDYNPGGEISTFDLIAWSLGYVYTKDQFLKFMDMNM